MNAHIAVGLQELLTSFAATGNATSTVVPEGVPVYGDGRKMLYIHDEGFDVVRDQSSEERCKFWQSGLYL